MKYILAEKSFKAKKKQKKRRHEGFARSHLPYYWPRLNKVNFPDRTRGVCSLISLIVSARFGFFDVYKTHILFNDFDFLSTKIHHCS